MRRAGGRPPARKFLRPMTALTADGPVAARVPPPSPGPFRVSLKFRIVLVVTAMVLGGTTYFLVRPPPIVPVAVGTSPPNEPSAAESTLRFYLARVQRDPGDTRSQDVLAETYLQLVRETGNEDYLPLARQAAAASLAAVPAIRNQGGLLALAHAEFSNHAFAAARDHARELIALDPGKGEFHAVLGDALVELGDYENAGAAYAKMQSLGTSNAGSEGRLARFALLHGAGEDARRHLQAARDLAQAEAEPSRETLAWCEWQLGELDFALGHYDAAETHDRKALQVLPNDFRALASLGRIRAAHGDLPGAISCYEQAVRLAPNLNFMAALGDLYLLAGRPREAAVQFELAEQMGEHSRVVHGTEFDRNLALFFADHDLKPEVAYQLARKEYEAGRRDVYGADALAWTALKAQRISEAQAASRDSLRLGTKDARLWYHAGMIARAAGNAAGAREFLERALKLNPQFDPRQRAFAQNASR